MSVQIKFKYKSNTKINPNNVKRFLSIYFNPIRPRWQHSYVLFLIDISLSFPIFPFLVLITMNISRFNTNYLNIIEPNRITPSNRLQLPSSVWDRKQFVTKVHICTWNWFSRLKMSMHETKPQSYTAKPHWLEWVYVSLLAVSVWERKQFASKLHIHCIGLLRPFGRAEKTVWI